MEAILDHNGNLNIEFLSQAQDGLVESKVKKYLKESPEKALFYLATSNIKNLPISIKYWANFSNYFIETLRLDPSVEELRENSSSQPEKKAIRKFLQNAPFMLGGEYLNEEFLMLQWDKLTKQFLFEIKSYKGSIEEYFAELNPEVHLAGRVFFHLVENKSDKEYPFAFMATYLADIKEKENPTHRPLNYALEEYANDSQKMLLLLATIKRACQKSASLQNLMDSGEIFSPLRWDANKAQIFLEEIPIYNRAGILCRIPNWWRAQSQGFKVNFVIGNKRTSFFGADSLLDFDIELRLGEHKLTESEVQNLLKESNGLAFLKGKWIKVDKDKLLSALDKWQEAKKLMQTHQMSFHDAMKLLSGQKNKIGSMELDEIEVSHGKWLDDLFKKLKNPDLIKDQVLSKKFKGQLRPYQASGFNWMNTLHSLRLGGLLADDMGLGKTIQVLAFLQKIIDKEKGLHLLIVPTSLLTNWENEIFKFSPKLKYLIAHASNSKFKSIKNITNQALKQFNLIITTYGLMRKSKWQQQIKWNYIILDEAQAIKNPATAQSKMIKSLSSTNRLALTGTPVENHIGDLWSLFDFINPGLLGSKIQFQNLNKQIEKSGEGYARLRNVINPYILRRLKTDKSIISDLPAKIEIKSYASLGRKQALHYSKFVDHIKNALLESDGIKRKGLILSSLIKFKQICNHPDQYLGTGTFNPKESGKFEKLKEIVEIIFEKREKVLIFTQFKEIIKPLDMFLSELSGRKGLILHGGTSVKQRKQAMETFQSSEYTPYFILSLKAGGTGLNLTAANHVIHFDRWWNPAVENQATDRAYRIGQKNKVIVHKFITLGTLEEKIDKMIEEKSKVVNDLIGKNNQKWLTEMSNDKIIELITMNQIE